MCLRSFVGKTPEFGYHSSGGWEPMIVVLAVSGRVLSVTLKEQKMHLLLPLLEQVLCLHVNEGIEERSRGLVPSCVL